MNDRNPLLEVSRDAHNHQSEICVFLCMYVCVFCTCARACVCLCMYVCVHVCVCLLNPAKDDFICLYIYAYTRSMFLSSVPMIRETGVQSQVESYQNGTWCHLLNTHYHMVWIKGKVKQSWEWNSVFPYTEV